MKNQASETPKHLYKVLALDLWQASENKKNVLLSSDDTPFIRFQKEDELGRLLHYWNKLNVPHVVLKIKANKLEGKLVFEAKLGGSTKQYHLYNGCIPINAIIESKIIQPK
jgi:uncharacterized protein (DUF952 family)